MSVGPILFIMYTILDGGWSDWSAWGACSVSCGYGLVRRHRNCDNPPPSFSGRSCVGNDVETDLCSNQLCQEFKIGMKIREE